MTHPRRRLVALSLAALLLSVASLVDAAVNAFWRELGGSASARGVSQITDANRFAFSASAAHGLDGRPVVAYADESGLGDEGDGVIRVKRWTGSAWQTLSPVAGIGSNGYGAQIKIAPSGTIYVAWFGIADNQVHLRRRTTPGTTWDELSGSDSPGGLTSLNGSQIGSFSLAVASDGSPLVAFTAPAETGVSEGADGILLGSHQVYVMQHMGAAGWQYLGSSPSTDGHAAAAGRHAHGCWRRGPPARLVGGLHEHQRLGLHPDAEHEPDRDGDVPADSGRHHHGRPRRRLHDLLGLHRHDPGRADGAVELGLVAPQRRPR